MDQLEQNIVNSFRLAKSDIIKTKNDVIELSKTQKRILEMLKDLNAKQVKLNQRVTKLNGKKVAKPKPVVKTKTRTVVKKVPVVKRVKVPVVKKIHVAKRAQKTFVASKEGKKFHSVNCPFAQNIKPKHKKSYKSKTKALNEGYKPCDCV